jgi:small subunit ribosomal protein S20
LPGISSAQKRAKEAEKRQLRNKSRRSQCKTRITKAEGSIFSGELKPAQELVAEATAALDKAAGKGVLHPNNAARRKSRLMKKLNEAQAKI